MRARACLFVPPSLEALLTPLWERAQVRRIDALDAVREVLQREAPADGVALYGSGLFASTFFPGSDLDLILIPERSGEVTESILPPPAYLDALIDPLQQAVPEVRIDLRSWRAQGDPDGALREALWLADPRVRRLDLQRQLGTPAVTQRDAFQAAGEWVLARTLQPRGTASLARFKSGPTAPLRLPGQLALLRSQPLSEAVLSPALGLEQALSVRAEALLVGSALERREAAEAEWLLRAVYDRLRESGVHRPRTEDVLSLASSLGLSSGNTLCETLGLAGARLRALDIAGISHVEARGVPVSKVLERLQAPVEERARGAAEGGILAALQLWGESDPEVASRALLALEPELDHAPWLLEGVLWNPLSAWTLVKQVFQSPPFLRLSAFHRRRGYRHVSLQSLEPAARADQLKRLLQLESDPRLRATLLERLKP